MGGHLGVLKWATKNLCDSDEYIFNVIKDSDFLKCFVIPKLKLQKNMVI